MGIVSRSGASAFFVSDGDSFAPRRELLLSAVTKVASTGRNCVSALPQRATVGCDFPHLLAGITFHHRCQSKGLRVRSPARRLTRPLASATAGVFSLLPPHPPSLPLEGFAVLNDTPVACQTRGPTDPQGDRCPHIPAALAATYHCGASHRDGRDLIIAKNDQRTSPYPRCCQRQRRKRYKRSLNRQCYPLHFMRECIPPNLHDPQRAK